MTIARVGLKILTIGASSRRGGKSFAAFTKRISPSYEFETVYYIQGEERRTEKKKEKPDLMPKIRHALPKKLYSVNVFL